MRGCIDWMMRGDDLDPSMAPLPSDMELGNWLVAPELGIVTWWLIIASRLTQLSSPTDQAATLC